MHEHHITVPRTARYYTLGSAGAPAQVWFVLHGYAQLASRFLKQFTPIDDGSRLIVAPEALSRFYLEPGLHGPESRVGATWMTREDRLSEINDYVAYLDALYVHIQRTLERPAADVRVLGFSQGAATASRWVAMGRSRIERLYLWGGFLPPDLELQRYAPALRAASVTVVLGREDAHASPERRAELEATMRPHGVEPVMVEYDGGHRVHADTLRALASG